MNVLVTGGAGFIGSHIVDRLIDEGHNVVIIDNMVTGQADLINPQATFYQEDICNAFRVEEIVKMHEIEVISHQAAQLDVRKSVEDPAFDAEVNIIGTINIFEAARKHGVKKVVFASSGGAIYGDTDQMPTPEGHPEQPISPYGVAKLVMEKYAHFYHVQYGLEYTAMRYANVYGPRQNAHGEAGVVAIFTDRMLAGQQCYVNGDGENTRDFVYVDDVVSANMAALTGDLVGPYNVATEKQTSVNQVFDTINAISGANQERVHREGKAGEQRHSCLSVAKLKQDADWSPTIDIQEGMKRTVEYFKSKN